MLLKYDFSSSQVKYKIDKGAPASNYFTRSSYVTHRCPQRFVSLYSNSNSCMMDNRLNQIAKQAE